MTIDGIKYIALAEAAERIGVEPGTMYQWNSDGRIQFGIRYLGSVYYEEKAIEPFKRSLMQKIRTMRFR